MERFVVYDSLCTVCTRMADAIMDAADGKVEPLSIYDDGARSLLDRAYPSGWSFAPYLLVVDRGRVRAWTGLAFAVHLTRLIGPSSAWRVWRVAKRRGMYLPPGGHEPSERGMSRRGFLKLSAGATGALAAVGIAARGASACEPCSTGTYGCGVRCRLTGVCVYNGDCYYSDGRYYGPYYCNRYSCYDGRTGEFCYSRLRDCSCVPAGTQCV